VCRKFVLLIALAIFLVGTSNAALSTAMHRTIKASSSCLRMQGVQEEEEIFVMAYPSDIGEMNPLFSRSERTGWYLIQVYDSLIAYDMDMDPTPWVAESWEISSDAKNFTFYIREGVKWHDGVSLNASDIKFTLEYYKAAPEDALSWSFLQKMEECTVHDEHTVSVVFNESLAFGLTQIGDINIVPKHVRDWGDWEHGNSQDAARWDDPDNVTAHTGSGPFKFVERTEDAYILLEKNSYWWGKEPNVDGIRIEVIWGQSARILAMKQGIVDTERYELMGAADIQAVTDAPELKLITEERPIPSQWDYVLGFNLAIPGLDDPIVRKAIGYALDREEIIEVAHGGYGTATWSVIPEAFFPSYYSEEGRFPELNVTYANQLLDIAGYVDTDGDWIRNLPTGEQMIFDVQVLSWDTISVDAGTAIASELAEIGISITVAITDDAVMYPNLYELPRDYRLYEMSHGFGGYPDHVWWRMHSCRDVDWGDNCYGLDNATMDAALDDLLHATNDTERIAAAAEIQKLSVELAPYIPLFLSDDTHAIRKEWVNYTFVPGGIFTSMNRLTMLNIYSMPPDVTLPEIAIISPANATYDITNVPLIFTVNEPTHWIGYSLDDAANVTITGNATLTDLSLGSHNIIVYANDTYGNMGASSRVYFTIDDIAPPNITDVNQIPSDSIQPEDEVKVNATVTDDLSGVKQVILNYTYTNSSGTWIGAVKMKKLEGNVWNATIPAFPYCTNVTYIIMAEDKVGNTITTDEMGYQYHVIPEFPSLVILPLFMIATLLAVVVYKRRHIWSRSLRRRNDSLDYA
jgi:ABC-type transport system substrate-binding protein